MDIAKELLEGYVSIIKQKLIDNNVSATGRLVDSVRIDGDKVISNDYFLEAINGSPKQPLIETLKLKEWVEARRLPLNSIYAIQRSISIRGSKRYRENDPAFDVSTLIKELEEYTLKIIKNNIK